MKFLLPNIVSTLLLSFFATLSFTVSAEKAPDSLNTLIPQLEKWGHNPVLVNAVNTQNSKDMTLDNIKKTDEEWRNTSEVNDFMASLMDNAAAKKMSMLETSMPFLVEIFLMDNQGANVAMTNKTSDYWQGDEAKFQQSFNGGKGKAFVGDVEYDDSVSAYLVQISVPVIDDQGQTIGAITIGVNLDEYENH